MYPLPGAFRKVLQLTILFGAVVSGSSAAAQNRTFEECGCAAFLADGIFLTNESVSTDQRNEALFRFFCSAEESVVIDVAKRSQNLNFFLPDTLDLTFSSGNEEQSLQEWRSRACENTENVVSSETLRRTLEEVANPSVVRGANQCFETCNDNGGLFCSITPVGPLDAIFSANWTPTDDNVTFPTVTGGDIVGGNFKTSAFGGDPVQEGMPIPVTGISATLSRTSIEAPLTVRLQTTKGSCSPSVGPVDSNFRVHVEVSGTGQRMEPVSQESGQLSIGNDGSCTESGVSQSMPVCLGSGATATGFTGPNIFSARNGAARVELGRPTPDCGSLILSYSDSGEDCYVGICNCKGNGWVGASTTITGERPGPWQLPLWEGRELVSVPAGRDAQAVFGYPAQMSEGGFDIRWTYSIKLERVTEDATLETVTLSSSNPNFDRFESSISVDGQVNLIIRSQ